MSKRATVPTTVMSIRYLGSTTALLVLLSACSGSTEPEEEQPTNGISVVTGNNQTDEPGGTLPVSPTVQVVEDGQPVQGQTVSWSVTSGGGSISATASTTDSNGRTSVSWTLGPNEGANTIEASVAGADGSPVEFTATAEVQPAAPSVASVTVRDNSFNPSSVRLAAGGTVTWTFSGALGHNVTFSSGSSSSTQSSGTFQRAFPAAGSFNYRCTIHAGMSGTVTVE